MEEVREIQWAKPGKECRMFSWVERLDSVQEGQVNLL